MLGKSRQQELEAAGDGFHSQKSALLLGRSQLAFHSVQLKIPCPGNGLIHSSGRSSFTNSSNQDNPHGGPL